MFTFIIIFILFWLFGMLTQSTAPPPSRKSKTNQSFKTNGSDTFKSVKRHKFTATLVKSTTPVCIESLEKVAKDRSEKEQHQASICDIEEEVRSPAEDEFKSENKFEEKVERLLSQARQRNDQTELTTPQANTNKEYETNKSSVLEAKNKFLAEEKFLKKHDYSDIDIQEQACIEPVEPVNFLSTTAYAKAYNLKAYPNLFNYLSQHQVVKRVDRKYELTNIGRSLGGQYQTGKDGNKWIVWPERSLDSYVTQLQQQLISEMPFDHLCHMTHIDNVAGIIQHGLQSHINTYKIKDISNLDVNIRRQKKETVNSKPIHSYVPFYFNARNAMLYQVQKQYGDQVVILGYDKSLVCHKGSVYSDGNAAANSTKFYGDLSTLLDHEWGEVFSVNWASHGDVDSNLKRKMMSEVLIDDTVPASELRVIYCASPSVERLIRRICTLKHVEVKVEPSLFF